MHEDLLALATVAAGIAVGVNALLLWRRRRQGVHFGVEPDPSAWKGFADSNQLTLMPNPRAPSMYGNFRGINVRLEGRWRQARADRTGVNQEWVTSTSIRATLGASVPAGLDIRRQGLLDGVADKLISGDAIGVDATVDKTWIIHGGDEREVQEFLRHPTVNRALMSLADLTGDVTIDDSAVRLDLPRYLTAWNDIEMYLGKLVRVVEAFREVAPPTEREKKAPIGSDPAIVLKPTLVGLLKKVTAAGGNATAIGREAIQGITGSACSLEVEVDRVEPYVTRLGVTGGISIVGRLVGWSSRVEVNFPLGPAADGARRARPGDRLAADGFIEVYDFLRDRLELMADKPPKTHLPESEVPRPPRLIPKDGVDVLLEVLAGGREKRHQAILENEGHMWLLRLAFVKAEPTDAWRVDGSLRDGRTVIGTCGPRAVEIRLPPERNAEIDGLTPGALLEADALLLTWDEQNHRAVFESRPRMPPLMG